MTTLPFAQFWRLVSVLPRHAPERRYSYWHRLTGDGVAVLVLGGPSGGYRPLDDSPNSRFPAPANGLG